MIKFRSHKCQIALYGENQIGMCKQPTQTRCSVCKQWCCSLHRHDLTRDLKRRITLCTECLEQEAEMEETEE